MVCTGDWRFNEKSCNCDEFRPGSANAAQMNFRNVVFEFFDHAPQIRIFGIIRLDDIIKYSPAT